jgi:hypothetical protein
MSQTKYLSTANLTTSRTIEFFPSDLLTSGITDRAIEAIRIVRSAFRRNLECTVTNYELGIVIECPDATMTAILEVCDHIEERLRKLQRQPLTAKMVTEVLSITSAELRRWSKDGRIPVAGRAFFGQGQKQIGLFLYAPEVIRDLVARPQQIAEWRRSGGGRDLPLQRSSTNHSRLYSSPGDAVRTDSSGAVAEASNSNQSLNARTLRNRAMRG